AECDMELDEVDRAGPGTADGRVRIGLGYVRGVRDQEVKELVAVRKAGGRFRTLSDLASRAGAGAPALELLAWSGACDSLVGAERRVGANRQPVPDRGAPDPRDADSRIPDLGADHRSERRIALWQLGVATPGRKVPGGTQLALPLDLPAPPPLQELSSWESMLADYGTTGLTTRAHPMALLRA